MSFWDVTKNLLTLGGAGRLERASARFALAREEYLKIQSDLFNAQRRISDRIRQMRRSGREAKRFLNDAYRILSPLKRLSRGKASSQEYSRTGLTSAAKNRAEISSKHVGSAEEHLVKGGVGGLLFYMTAWQGIQVLGTASTGTAIFGLHGIAASNAGWAWAGGGSLATGGGGMAVGHLVLPGVGILVAVGVSTFTTHKNANALNARAQQLEEANPKNAVVLHHATVGETQLNTAFSIFEEKKDLLSEAVSRAKRNLRRFGFITGFYRYSRTLLGGEYYTRQEMRFVRDLEVAVQSFLEGLVTSSGASSGALATYRSDTLARRIGVVAPAVALVLLGLAGWWITYRLNMTAKSVMPQVAITHRTTPSLPESKVWPEALSASISAIEAPRTIEPNNKQRSSVSDQSPEALKKINFSGDVPDEEIRLQIEHWRLALLSNKPEIQATPYSSHMERYFLQSDWTRSQVQGHFEDLHSRGRFARFSVSQIVVDRQTPSEVDVHFTKDFSIERSGVTTSATVRTVLHFVPDDGEWKINYERDFKQ